MPEFKKVWTEYKELGSHALQATLKRVDFAYQRFFTKKGGYPKLWYASITVNCEVVRVTGDGATGLDFGVLYAVAMSDGTIIDAPKFLAKEIKKANKENRRKRSPNQKKKINIKGMTHKAKKGSKRKAQKTGLNRNMLDVGIEILKSAIAYKVHEAGGSYIKIPTQKAKPSQTCPMCGRVQKKELRIEN